MAGNDGLSDEFVLHRLTASGNPDPAFFGGNLYRSSSGISDALIYRTQLQRDGKLVVLGGEGSDIVLKRFHTQTPRTATAVIEVRDDERITVSVSPSTISGNGGTATGTVTVTNTNRTSDLVVTLVSNDISEATVPSTVTIPANEQSATFTTTAVDDTILDGRFKSSRRPMLSWGRPRHF